MNNVVILSNECKCKEIHFGMRQKSLSVMARAVVTTQLYKATLPI